uniref:Dynein heavy chain hydrolytic ATP-binding dynein motor region domain-containing protein n=1 Tax=Timema douglasi TaxID=61478 RepID=A0A7R8VGS7_TIMDO|nr:unnamed protein product [Timema douglasi]
MQGMVEKWLAQVEEQMVQSMKDTCMEAIQAYFSTAKNKWLLDWPGQIVICAECVHWTAEVAQAIEDSTLPDYLRKSNDQIDEMVKMVRGKLSSGARTTMGALIVIDVHAQHLLLHTARDVITKLISIGIKSTQDFNWICQLRYYWREGSVYVAMITTEVMYGFEYLGNSTRLVITPLTDRCYRSG